MVYEDVATQWHLAGEHGFDVASFERGTRDEIEIDPLVSSVGGPRKLIHDNASPESEPAGAVRVCLRDLGLGLASIIPRSCRLCDGNAERLRLDELLGFEARREVEVGSEPALLPRDCDVERKSDQKSEPQKT